ncbi:uncharacterized protein BKA55DRAFT_695577 [Fusarium redolens]|uniref:Uncharacterized protein n=1 Tax=Fusarium redolens TaxID=48865 RepID=A0A9P9JPD9_FUSRE|nr:uncharacterized protein BKA55DRAFT_695577 [Fusarium redolens]KAH7232153.1 hypothetical protein BKA55DRAFT_695577 [Fusarium redolens]
MASSSRAPAGPGPQRPPLPPLTPLGMQSTSILASPRLYTSPSTFFPPTQMVAPKRKLSPSFQDLSSSSRTARPRIEESTGLTPTKILKQLSGNERLTDDVLNLICQVIRTKCDTSNGRALVLHPLWLFDNDHSPKLPREIRQLRDDRWLCFPIHHDGDH